MPRRPQCQRRRSQILPAATPGGDHPVQQQVDEVRVLRERRRRAPEPVPQQLENGAVGRAEIFRRRVLQLPGGQRPVGAPAARFEDADHAQIKDKGQAWPRRVIETIGDLIRTRLRAGRLMQLLQPTADRPGSVSGSVPSTAGGLASASSSTAAACLQFHATGQLQRADSETGLPLPMSTNTR